MYKSHSNIIFLFVFLLLYFLIPQVTNAQQYTKITGYGRDAVSCTWQVDCTSTPSQLFPPSITRSSCVQMTFIPNSGTTTYLEPIVTCLTDLPLTRAMTGTGEGKVECNGGGGAFGPFSDPRYQAIQIISGCGAPPPPPPSAPVINQPPTCYGNPYDPKVDLSWSNTGASSYTLKSCIWSSCDSQRDVPGCIGITGTSCTDDDARPADMYYWVRDNTTGLESNRVQVECLQCRLHSPATSNVGDTIIYSTHTRTPSFTFAGGGTPASQGPSSNPFFSTVFNVFGSKQVTVISPLYTQALNCPAVNIIATPSPTPVPTPTPSPSEEPPLPSPVRDTRPPEISNVRIINITQTGATVLWNTDEASDSQVEYCLTASRCGTLTFLDASLTSRHSVNLSGLIPDKYYYIWAKSKDASGNPRILGYYLFKTLAGNVILPTPTPRPRPSPTPTPVPINPPVISNVQITNITRNSATVTWDTDRPADSRAINCAVVGFWCSILGYDSSFVTQHSLALSSLTADRTYRIRVYSKDSSGIQGRSGWFSFKTEPGLIVFDVKILNITRDSVSVAWKTNYPADSKLVVCIPIFWCWGGGSAYDSAFVSEHMLIVPGLKNNTRYSYRVRSVDALNYETRSKTVYLLTLP